MEKNEAAEALRVKAWAADRAGNTGDAMMLFRRIVEQHPNSEAAKDARQYIASEPYLAERVGTTTGPAPIQLVRVVDFDVSFGSLVWLFVKGSIALIPAAIILAVIWALVSGVVVGVLTGLR